jgi:hypothetical protein
MSWGDCYLSSCTRGCGEEGAMAVIVDQRSDVHEIEVWQRICEERGDA